MSKNENRLNFRMTDETAAKIERWYQEDNCRSKNEFIEKAVNCYADMLAAGESTTLPYLCLLRRNFCAAGDVLFGYSGAILGRSRSPSH